MLEVPGTMTVAMDSLILYSYAIDWFDSSKVTALLFDKVSLPFMLSSSLANTIFGDEYFISSCKCYLVSVSEPPYVCFYYF